MDINSVRLENTELVIDRFFDRKKIRLADALGKKPTYISRWWATNETQKRNISANTARLIEIAAKLPNGWLDFPHESYELETDRPKKIQKQINAGDTHKIQLLDRCTIDNDLALTLLNIKLKGELMLLSTDKDAYAFEFIGHHSEKLLSDRWGIVIEPDTPLTEGEYAVLKLTNGQLLLRVITYSDEKTIVAMNPLNKQQNTMPMEQIESAQYCYIGIPPSKIIRTDKE